MNKVKGEILSNITKLNVKVFTHNDLDGISCAIVFKKLYDTNYISFDFEFISYNDYDKIKEFMDFENGSMRLYDYVFFTDLNFTKETFNKYIELPLQDFRSDVNGPNPKKLNSLFKKIFIIDHHKDSEEAIRPKENRIFNFIEYYNDMTHCASLQLYDWCINTRSSLWTEKTIGMYKEFINTNKLWLESYLKHVNDWDLFHWKENGNMIALDLNLLFSHMRREKFIMMQIQKSNVFEFVFNKSESSIIKEIHYEIEKQIQYAKKCSCLMEYKDSYGDYHPNFNYLVIKCDDNVSLICDRIKDDILRENNPYNIVYIANVSFKYNSINLRRIDETLDLSKLANHYNGGGHPFAAGFTLDVNNPEIMQDFVYPALSRR